MSQQPQQQTTGGISGNTINVSLQRSPVFYANVTKRYIQGGENEVHLTGLGNATGTVVGTTEILKRQAGLIQVKKIETSLTDRGVARYSLLVTLSKGEKFDELHNEPPATAGLGGARAGSGTQ